MNGAKLKAPNAHPASRRFMIVGIRAPSEPVQSGRHASRFKRRKFGFNVQLWRPDDDATARRGGAGSNAATAARWRRQQCCDRRAMAPSRAVQKGWPPQRRRDMTPR
jgi:hypothetical protein